MHPLLETAVFMVAVTIVLAALFALIDLPLVFSVPIRYLLVAGWFWYVGWQAILGLIVLEFMTQGSLVLGPTSELIAHLEARGKNKRT